MKAGVCWITFKEGVSDETIQIIINSIYTSHKGYIEGMEFNQFKDSESMNLGKKEADRVWKTS